MKHSLLLLFLLFFSVSGQAQKLHRQYSFFPQEEGNVYFIYPQKGFTCTDSDAVKGLEYDITYLSGKDSATFVFSYFTQPVLQAKEVRITAVDGTTLYEQPVQMMFSQPKKNYWHQRAQFRIPYALLIELYRKEQPFTLTLIGGKELTYQIKPKNWKNQSEMINKIFEIVQYNR